MRTRNIGLVNCNSRSVRGKKKQEEEGGGKSRRRERKMRMYLGALNEFVVKKQSCSHIWERVQPSHQGTEFYTL